MAAQQANAMTRSPVLYRRAEFYYLKAKSAYKRKYFNKALEYSKMSQKYSEKAEFVASREEALENL